MKPTAPVPAVITYRPHDAAKFRVVRRLPDSSQGFMDMAMEIAKHTVSSVPHSDGFAVRVTVGGKCVWDSRRET